MQEIETDAQREGLMSSSIVTVWYWEPWTCETHWAIRQGHSQSETFNLYSESKKEINFPRENNIHYLCAF